MPNSLRTKFNNMRHKGRIDEAEYQALIKKLDGHDSDLLDKVMQKGRTIIDEDGVMYKAILLKDIEDMKAEVSKWMVIG